MKTEYYREYSPNLGRDMEYKVYGHAGRPMLVFPCQDGRFFDFEDRGMVDIAEDLDMLELCSKYDEDTFFVFYDILFDTDIFDWFSIENMFDDFHSEDELKTD